MNKFPELKGKVPEGQPGSGLGAEVYKVNAEKSQKVLGLKYRGLDESITDTARTLLRIEQAKAAA